MIKVGILGASGSIGQQTIDVLKNNKDKFELVAFSVGGNIAYANEILKDFDTVSLVSVQNEADIDKIKCDLVVSGAEGLNQVATYESVDILITAVVGFVGLIPTVNAIKAKKNIGLANKETLVTAGHIIMPLAQEMGINIYPVDSEHSAIFQCLNGENNQIDKLLITASGGSFRDKTREQLKTVNVAEALNHPNWSMGKKITIDSATMFNKGLEVIEAHHLFNVDYDNIEVVIHKESVIHSMVQFKDYSVMAQLGTPDMRLPISYALSYPQRLPITNSKPLNLFEIKQLNFIDVDTNRYPAVELSFRAGRIGGSMPTVLNAANEIAVDLFLNEKISFLEIETIVKQQMDLHNVIENPTLDEILAVDKQVRKNVAALFNKE